MSKKISYKTSGVDIRKANTFVRGIKGYMQSTMDASVIKRKGAFGALYSGQFKGIRNPVLVSSTDGVGTKLCLAKLANKHDTVGIDLVAMNVNDILCVGAKPLFFLDYIACGKLKPGVLKSVVKGIANGCAQAGCSLIGGETAEMPGIYAQDDYDLAGFAVGVVDKKKIIDGAKIKVGDQLIGLASSGVHSNGFSLVRKVFSKNEQKKYARDLLKPTRIYVKEVMAVINKFDIKGIAHITGGAFYDKLTKILPSGKCFEVRRNSWPVLNVFKNLQKKGKINNSEMYRTFNMGIGMVLAVSPKDAKAVIQFLRRKKVKSYQIGKVINNRNKKIVFI